MGYKVIIAVDTDFDFDFILDYGQANSYQLNKNDSTYNYTLFFEKTHHVISLINSIIIQSSHDNICCEFKNNVTQYLEDMIKFGLRSSGELLGGNQGFEIIVCEYLETYL